MMAFMKKIFLILILIYFIPVTLLFAQSKVKVGADVLLEEKLELIKGKKLGIVTNHTAVLADGTHLVDALHKIDGVQIVALYGPEHGKAEFVV